MTDVPTYQIAVVAPTRGNSAVNVNQLAAVILTPYPPTGFISVNQIAFVALAQVYVIPQVFTPLPCGKFLQTFPYWVGENPNG